MKRALRVGFVAKSNGILNALQSNGVRFLVVVMMLMMSGGMFGQTWIYNFGTGTGTHTSTTASTSFLPTPSSGGGTSRVRVGTNPGSFVLANPGISLGSTSELQFASNTGSSSTSKFSIYDYTPSKVGYIKFKVAFNGGTNGIYYFTIGDGATFSDNNTITTAQIFSGIEFSLLASNAITYKVLNGSTYGATGISNSTTLFSQSISNEYAVEVYLNNNSTSSNYVRSGTTYSLTSSTWDLWVNGTKVGTNLSKGGLGTNVNIDSFAFNHQVSSTTPGVVYLDDLEYSNILPTVAVPTISTTTATSITTTGASSGGNITADGGASVTARGVYFGTTATPASGTSDGTGTGSFTSSLSSLAVNTQYYYRAYATNSAGTGYGTESSFYTLANVPSAPTVATPSATTLNVSITSGDGNPASTAYALHETITNQFVQANGSLGATAVWQTATTWGTKTVTGLTPSTLYTFEAKARNGANTETAYSATANGTTLANETLDYWNLQFPSSQTIAEGGTFNVYAQAYKAGLTEAGGQAAGLTAWIGYSASNSNPNGAGWTWVTTTFNAQAGNNDEFVAALGTGLTPGTYYYASRFQLGAGTYTYGGTGGNWSSNSGVLTVQSNKVDWANIQSPVSGTIVQGGAFDVYSRVYKPGLTGNANPHTGITAWIGYNSSNVAPSAGGWTWIAATRNTGFSDLSNDEYSADIGTGRTAGTYYYAARYQVTGSTEYFYAGHAGGPNTGGEWGNPVANISGTLVVQTPREINIKQGVTNIASNATYAFASQTSGTSSSAITFTVENTGQENLSVGTLSITGTNASEFSITQVSGTLPLIVGGVSTTTFTVTFSPTSTGAKTAQLSLINNDANENPYLINLTGTAGLANDNCSGATSITINAAAINGTLAASTYTTPFTSKNDVWYKFVPLCSVSHSIIVTGFTGDVDIYLFNQSSNCPTTTTSIGTATTSNPTETITSSLTSGVTYYIRVIAFDAAAEAPFTIQVTGVIPGTSTTITPTNATTCVGISQTYTATTVTNATSYNWSFPSGWTVVTPSTTNTISVTPSSTTGNVSVTAVNCYGSGIAKTLSSTPSVPPATPGTISGNTPVCEGSASNTYTIVAVSGATSYTWTLPSGWSGTSTTNSITATAGITSGNITVTANNACGSSSAQTLAVTVSNVTAPAGSISVASSTCGTTTLAYSAPSANLYWQTSAAGTSTANPTTANYVVNTTSAVYVRNFDGTCWSAGNATFTPTVTIAPSVSVQPTPQSVNTGTTATFTVTATGTVSTYQWQVNSGSGFVNVSTGTGGTTATYTTAATTLSMNGYTYQCIIYGTAPCGNATTSSVSLSVANGPCLSDNFDTNWGNWSGGSGTYNNSSAGNTGMGIGFNGVNDEIINAVALLNPASIKFKGKANSTSGTYTIKVQRSTSASGPWTDVSTFNANGANTGTITDSWFNYDIAVGLTGNHFIKIIMSSQSNGSFFLDDLEVYCGLPCTPPATPATPTSNSPQCAAPGVTLSKVGTAPTDEIWYWQTTATGTDIAAVNSAATYTVTSVGTTTIYLRSRNTVTDCWSTASSIAVTVNATTAVTNQPLSANKIVGSTAIFTVTAVGGGLTYQWEINTGSGWNNVTGSDGTGGTTASFTTVTNTLAMSGYQYRVAITGNCGSTISNGLATLTVTAAPLCSALLEENFEYGCASSNDLVTLSGTNWNCFSSCTSTFNYSNTGLSYSEYASSGIGGAALMTATADDIRRSFTTTTTGSVYVSFLLNLNNGTTTTNDHFIDLGSNINNLAVRLHSVKINASTFRLGVSKGQTTSTNTSGALNFGTTYLVVLKYQFVAGTTNDLVSLWAFSSGVPASEAAAGSATVTASDNLTFADATNLQWLVLRQDQARGLIDGLRVATSWSDALCIVPATTAKTYTWTGGGNTTDWTNNCNWSPLGVPTSIDNIIINTAPTSKLNITDSRTVKDFTLNGTGHFDMSNTGVLTITGNITYGGTPTATLHCDSQVYITNSSVQTIPAINYGNLDVLGGNRIFPNGGTIGICAGFNVDPTIYTYTVTGSTVNYFSSQTGWTMTPFTYHNLTMSGTGDFSFGYSSPAINKTVNVLGNFLQTAGTVYLGETSSATATMNIDGNMTLTGGTYNVNRYSGGTGIINLKGNLSVGGTLTATSSADTAHLNFLGTTNQTVSGAGTMNIYRSVINKPSGYVDLQRNLEIKRVLTMTKGNIATNANTLTLGESTSNVGTLTYTSGYVIGKMTRWFATGATSGNSGLFPLGASTNQNRFASINYANVSTSGRLTAEIVNTAMGSIGSITIPITDGCSAFDPTTGESFYWKIASAGVVGTTYTASFTNQTLTAIPLCNLTLLNRNPTTWASTGTHIVATGTTTNYTVSRSGLTTYGDFGVGKKGLCDTTKTWAAGAWTGGDGLAPSITDAVIFAGNYNTATLPNVASCECIINPGVTITIGSGKTLSIEYGLTLSDNVTPTDLTDDGKLIIADGGSLVQVTNPTVDGTGNSINNNTGNIKMYRITQPMYRYDYTYWGSPVTGTTLHDLSPDTLGDKYFWWNPSSGWTISYNGAESMVPGKGYIIRAPQTFSTDPTVTEPYGDDPGDGFFQGVPNNGIIKRSVTSGAGIFNLIGNPYPSAMDAIKFIDGNLSGGNGSIEGTLYFWTHNTPVANLQYSANDYATFNKSGGTATHEALSDDDPADNSPNGFIAAGQAFFVEGNTTQEVLFNNDMRAAGSNNQFFKPGPPQPIENWEMTGKHRVWLNLKNAQTGFNQALVGYMENATNDYDLGYDGKSFGGNQVMLYSLNDDKKLTIQARALPFSNQDEVPLGYKTTLNGTLKISIDHYDGLFEGQAIYLEDQLLNIVHDLKESDYSFTSVVGTFNDRFVLRYLPSEELSNPDPEAIANGLIVYKNDNTIQIQSQLEALEQVTVYDLLGRIVYDKSGIDQNELGIQDVVMNEQPLIVKVKLANGQVVNKKIIY